MKVKCYSVRLESLVPISPRALKARSFDGSEDILPASQVFGDDFESIKSDAYWISAWILEKKSIQYSIKKEAWFDKDTGRRLPTYKVEKHVPKKIEDKDVNPDPDLKR